jgi:hypothetical protein
VTITVATKIAQREQIIADVLRHHGITRDDLFSRWRNADLVEARADAARRLRAAGFTLKAIARALRRDHTTVMYYIDDTRRRMDRAHEDTPPIDLVKEGMIVALWQRVGLDTYDIAVKLGLREWQVHNRLLHLREGKR